MQCYTHFKNYVPDRSTFRGTCTYNEAYSLYGQRFESLGSGSSSFLAKSKTSQFFGRSGQIGCFNCSGQVQLFTHLAIQKDQKTIER